jgi:hypothetical protein
VVARWSMNLTIWSLTTFLTHLIRQTWVLASFGYLECRSRKLRIECFSLLKKLWLQFTVSETNWPWKTCSPFYSIVLNELNVLSNIRENNTQTDIKRSCESLSHGEIWAIRNFLQILYDLSITFEVKGLSVKLDIKRSQK